MLCKWVNKIKYYLNWMNYRKKILSLINELTQLNITAGNELTHINTIINKWFIWFKYHEIQKIY